MILAASKSSSAGFETPERLKIPAGRLLKAMEWFTRDESVPPATANAFAATLWLLEVDAFREAEEEFLLSGDYDKSLSDHRVILSTLIAKGETVAFEARRTGLAQTRFTIEDLQATLNSLHRTFRGEHGPGNPPKTDHLIEQLLNGAKPESH
jgi:hypothetical protein